MLLLLEGCDGDDEDEEAKHRRVAAVVVRMMFCWLLLLLLWITPNAAGGFQLRRRQSCARLQEPRRFRTTTARPARHIRGAIPVTKTPAALFIASPPDEFCFPNEY